MNLLEKFKKYDLRMSLNYLRLQKRSNLLYMLNPYHCVHLNKFIKNDNREICVENSGLFCIHSKIKSGSFTIKNILHLCYCELSKKSMYIHTNSDTKILKLEKNYFKIVEEKNPVSVKYINNYTLISIVFNTSCTRESIPAYEIKVKGNGNVHDESKFYINGFYKHFKKHGVDIRYKLSWSERFKDTV